VEKAIRGRRLEGQTLEDAAQAAVEGADPLPGNTYKIDLFKGVIREELAAIARQ
jgi:xanthine dehydrogenase YagS FAD-binding subunit